VLTVHRSQGSTFGEVYVAGDVFWPQDAVLRRQLAYVAVSRASQAVWLMAGGGAAAEQEADRRRWHDWLRQGAEPIS
jgi:exodeoxyribonuclease-5